MALLDPISTFKTIDDAGGPAGSDASGCMDSGADVHALGFAESLAHGLSLRPRRIASKWLFDDVGAALFEDVVASPRYYVARVERQILSARATEIAQALGSEGSLVELGSGASTKVRCLLDAMPTLRRYVPIEISRAQLLDAAQAIRADYPGLEVVPIAADFFKDIDLPATVREGPVLGVFLGTTLCNLMPEDSVAFLSRMRVLLGPDALFLAGVDVPKDTATLLRAYNDPGGPIWDFNLNILARMNRELGTDLAKADFRHEAVWNADEGRIEATIYPLRDQSVTAAGQRLDLPANAPIVLEYSYKYTLPGFQALAERAGWSALQAWTDPDHLFSVHLLANRAST